MDDHRLNLPNAHLYVINNFVIDTHHTFDYLINNLNWSYDQGSAGRQSCNMGLDYIFANQLHKAHPIDPMVLALMNRLNREFNTSVNAAHAGLYANGEAELHFRNEIELATDLNQPVFTVSYGGSRYFTFKDVNTLEEYDFLINDGDLCIMADNCQRQYFHAIKKSTLYTEPRISLSFRRIQVL
jgi:alkylated DNA repair dioxygenase AlkB